MPLVVLLVAIFIAVPIAELYVILKVGDAIGAPLTILVLVADSILGSLLLRAQGQAVWARFRSAYAERRPPHQEVIDGVLVVFGGALLLTPGFLTDAVGLLLLVPPTRAVVRRILLRRLGRRVIIGVAGAARGRREERAQGHDFEGTATEYEATSPRLER